MKKKKIFIQGMGIDIWADELKFQNYFNKPKLIALKDGIELAFIENKLIYIGSEKNLKEYNTLCYKISKVGLLTNKENNLY